MHCRIISPTMIELIMMDLVLGDVMISLQILKILKKLYEWVRHKGWDNLETLADKNMEGSREKKKKLEGISQSV